jgi:hypothetical protein
VPHNLYLSTKYNAHINVEICNTIGAVKYLFKYVYKGSDKVTFSLAKPNDQAQQESSTNQIFENQSQDEITNFLNARYVSASEAVWRIFEYNTNSQDPHTVRLVIHLEDQQNVLFDDGANLDNVLEKNLETQLTQYLKLSGLDPEVRQLHYYQMPLKYVWNKSQRQWTKRIR